MRLVTLATAVALLAAASSAMAQTLKSTDEIVRELTPKAGAATPAGQTSGGTMNLGLGKTAGIVPRKPPPVASNLQVLFASGSADLTAAGRAQLDALGTALQAPALGTAHFRIEGHTDTTGDTQLNLTLSQRRAAAVVAYLVAKFGIAGDRLAPVGMGKQGLLVQTPDQTPEPANRRVVVINLDS